MLEMRWVVNSPRVWPACCLLEGGLQLLSLSLSEPLLGLFPGKVGTHVRPARLTDLPIPGGDAVRAVQAAPEVAGRGGLSLMLVPERGAAGCQQPHPHLPLASAPAPPFQTDKAPLSRGKEALCIVAEREPQCPGALPPP